MLLVPFDGTASWRAWLADPDKHWKPGYSAFELATRWEGSRGFPPEIIELFSRHEASRGMTMLFDAITLTPSGGELRIELKGNLAAMLGATIQSKRTPETGALSLQVSMVAGARLKLYRKLCWAAA